MGGCVVKFYVRAFRKGNDVTVIHPSLPRTRLSTCTNVSQHAIMRYYDAAILRTIKCLVLLCVTLYGGFTTLHCWDNVQEMCVYDIGILIVCIAKCAVGMKGNGFALYRCFGEIC